MASNRLAMASNPLAMACNLLAIASNLLAMASNPLTMACKPTSDGLQPTSDGLHPQGIGLQPTSDGLQPTSDGLPPSGHWPPTYYGLHLYSSIQIKGEKKTQVSFFHFQKDSPGAGQKPEKFQSYRTSGTIGTDHGRSITGRTYNFMNRKGRLAI